MAEMASTTVGMEAIMARMTIMGTKITITEIITTMVEIMGATSASIRTLSQPVLLRMVPLSRMTQMKRPP